MRVLIVDDSRVYRKALQQELSVTGYELEQESDPRAVIERLKSEHFDLVTLDMEMPELDGLELCKLIRGESEAHLQELPVVFVTGADTIEGRIKCFESGASHFVPKAFPKGELLSVVKGLLEPETRFRHHTILIADDSGIVRKSLDQTLRRFDATKLISFLLKMADKLLIRSLSTATIFPCSLLTTKCLR